MAEQLGKRTPEPRCRGAGRATELLCLSFLVYKMRTTAPSQAMRVELRTGPGTACVLQRVGGSFQPPGIVAFRCILSGFLGARSCWRRRKHWPALPSSCFLVPLPVLAHGLQRRPFLGMGKTRGTFQQRRRDGCEAKVAGCEMMAQLQRKAWETIRRGSG